MAALTGPSPDTLHPLQGFPRVAFLRPLAEGLSNVEVGRFSYYDDPDGPERFFEHNVLHHYDFVGDKLVIGPFCAFATGVRILMNGANHATAGLSAYPFEIFGKGWDAGFEPEMYEAGYRGDTVIGPDVWFGHEAVVLPGVTIGAGAVIGARAVVVRDVAPYTVVAGNPASMRRRRFDEMTVERLLALAWWDWPVEKITAALPAIRAGDLDTLEAMQ